MSQKAHILIVIGMVVMMYIAYSLVSRWQDFDKPDNATAPTLIDESIYIQFDSATYGDNCNGRVMDSSIAQRLGVESYEKGGFKRFVVNDNNALEAVKNVCGHTVKCKLTASESALGFDPAPRCDKHLKVSYRCFNFDVRKEATAGYGGDIEIDCTSASK